MSGSCDQIKQGRSNNPFQNELGHRQFSQQVSIDSSRTYKLELYSPAPSYQCWYSNPKSLALE